MARTTKQLSGGGKDKFLRGLVEAVADVPEASARRLGDILADGITDVRVKREVWETLRTAPLAARPPAPLPATSSLARPVTSPPAEPAAPPPVLPAFDPFAFSAVAVLTRKGKAALAGELATITDAAQLREFAIAQHLAVDPGLMDAAALREALIAATERRIAERKAAAS